MRTKLTIFVSVLLSGLCILVLVLYSNKSQIGKNQKPRSSKCVTVYSAKILQEAGEPPPEGFFDTYYDELLEDRQTQLRNDLLHTKLRDMEYDSSAYIDDDYNPWDEPYGIGLIYEEYERNLPQGRSLVQITDVARYMEPATVRISQVGGGARVRVLEQNFIYDTISTEALMRNYTDKQIAVVQKNGKELCGKLLLKDKKEALILETSPGVVEVIPEEFISRYKFPILPEGVMTKPTLEWLVDVKEAGPIKFGLSYRTRGLAWLANYSLLLKPEAQTLTLGSKVSILNCSGARILNTRLKLVAGVMNLIEPIGYLNEVQDDACYCVAPEEDYEEPFEEKGFYEYYLYTLRRLCSLGNREIKEIELLRPTENIPYRMEYIFRSIQKPMESGDRVLWDDELDSVRKNTHVDTTLHFRNEKAVGLGRPMPEGVVRIMTHNSQNREVIFVTNETIEHTPKDEEVSLNIGPALGLSGVRRQINFEASGMYDFWARETIELEIFNDTEKTLDVIAREHMYRDIFWELESSTHTPSHNRTHYPRQAITDIDISWEKIISRNSKVKNISLFFENKPLVKFAEELSKLTNTKIVVDRDSSNETLKEWTDKNAPLLNTVRHILQSNALFIGIPNEPQADAEILITSNEGALKHVVRPVEPPEWRKYIESNASILRLSYDFTGRSLEECIDIIAAATNLMIRISDEAEDSRQSEINLKVNNKISVIKIMEMIALQAEVSYSVFGTELIVVPAKSPRCSVILREFPLPDSVYASDIADMIIDRIAPSSWGVELGTSLEERDGSLIVMQTAPVIARIAPLVHSINKAFDNRCVDYKVKVPARGSTVIRYTVLYAR